jgi:hypothetical protein
VSVELRPQLGAHAEALIADVLDKREEAIILGVITKLSSGPLDPQLALQAWIAIAEARSVRRQLIKRAELENARHAKVS